jgi:hypothetical protein
MLQLFVGTKTHQIHYNLKIIWGHIGHPSELLQLSSAVQMSLTVLLKISTVDSFASGWSYRVKDSKSTPDRKKPAWKFVTSNPVDLVHDRAYKRKEWDNSGLPVYFSSNYNNLPHVLTTRHQKSFLLERKQDVRKVSHSPQRKAMSIKLAFLSVLPSLAVALTIPYVRRSTIVFEVAVFSLFLARLGV